MNLSGVTFVIVNSHEGVRSALAAFLRQKGAIVFVSRDAFGGLAAVKNHKPDIVISAVRLPKRDGFELLRDIRALGPEAGGNVPVIATTILAQIADQHRIAEAGFQAHVDKPFGPNELLEAIKPLLPLKTGAVQRWLTAKKKFRLDRFNRRFPVFEAAMRLAAAPDRFIQGSP